MKKGGYLVAVACCALVLAFSVSVIEASAPSIKRIRAILEPSSKVINKDLLIVGDVMLARSVEKYMREKGLENPFSKVKNLLASYDYVLGNFEGAIPEVHVPTPGMGFRFSIAEDIASALTTYGFTHLGLANNHAFDFGLKGYEHGHQVLESHGHQVGGNPLSVSEDDVMYMDMGEIEISIVPIFALDSNPSAGSLAPALSHAASTSDIQIAYIHWGAEYEPMHNRSQESLARTLISLGIDAVVGHHPHVIQDIAVYEGVPVFYSLGNFIFDQYWEESVRTGLALGVRIDERDIVYELVGVRSVERTVPQVLEGIERDAFLEAVAKRSDTSLESGIQEGELRFKIPNLASTVQ